MEMALDEGYVTRAGAGDGVSDAPGAQGIGRDEGFSVNVANAFNRYTIDFKPPCRVRCAARAPWRAPAGACSALMPRWAAQPSPACALPVLRPPRGVIVCYAARHPLPRPNTPDVTVPPQRHNMTSEMSLILYGVPTAPGWTRLYVSFAGAKSNPGRLPNAPGMPRFIRAFVNALTLVTPLFHAITQNAIIGGCGADACAPLFTCRPPCFEFVG